MQVQKQFVDDFLQGKDNTFIIPVYQRDYAWKKSNCKKLWEDIINLQNSGKPSHFLGALVTIYNNQKEWMVIDGQQRLTTISLLLLALVNYLKVKPNKTQEEKELGEDISDYYLINKRCKDKLHSNKLKPNTKDKDYFQKLLFDDKLNDKLNNKNNDSNIIKNYHFFYDEISKSSISVKDIYGVFKKLEIVHIELEKGTDDPQLIFESLNSTGVDLTDGDLIRNYILMDLIQSEQQQLYNNYWIKIEQLAGNVANFIRVFLMYTLHKDITQSNRAVYNEFKQYSKDKFYRDSYRIDSYSILQHLLKYAEIYSYFVNISDHPDKNINKALHRLHRLEFTVCHPFLMDVFDLFNQGVLGASDVQAIIELIESYAFRKFLVNSSTQGLNKFFLTLSKEIRKETQSTWKANYFDIMSFIIKNKSGTLKFPSDEEFKEKLIHKELKSKNRDFLLENLENYNSDYKIDVEELTIEHIMPQKLNHKWKQDLGDKYSEIHGKYLHTLGNLTLIEKKKNNSLSNKDFKSKQKIDFETSKLNLSSELKNIEEWNENSIVNRANRLAEEAVKIWKYPVPKSTYAVYSSTKDIQEDKIHNFAEGEFTNTKPKTLIVGEDKYKLKTWQEVVKKICEILFNESPTEFNSIMTSAEFKGKFCHSNQKENSKFRAPKELEFTDSYFVETHGSANTLVDFCCKLCKKLDFNIENISIEIS
ncbi:DUF262 domain-containing protein [Anabaenopsis arnoldii]|uniref:DUF262 domain-containing HNH endonuclease family protein n=1 Tax=Anabaenopsis arnoldii TaxID=2152938 RepID=A0ABT5ARJ8_9CYAN|nr:DUF262 domain-containing HNH endonuclease family protein [Anabaenopsis arnoldii]MDB9538985.1 DUF262 domain-containing HNH endonuclease family protein [Anabaenopsis arnoldii]MDH6091273.1 DUF262 domain-containing HNH endonuclease family protein [Anabaenopsis arnoldii]